jgi:glycosyltransferase involved in cell wall biosynthesis
MNVTAVLCLAPLTRSIAFRPYLATLAGRPVLAHLAERVLALGAADRFLVLAHYEAEREALEEALAGTGAELRFTRCFSELQALGECAAEFNGGTVATLTLASVAAPADLLERMLRHHRSHQSTFTLLDNAPAGIGMGVLEADTLRSLLHIAEPFNFSAPDEALRRLVALGEAATQRLPITLRFAPFELARVYAVAPEKLPLEAPLNRAAEFAELEKAWGNISKKSALTELLQQLKQLQTTRMQEALKLPAASLAPCTAAPGKRKRVLILSLPSAFSGAEQALCSMLRFIDRERFEVVVVTSWEGLFAERLRAAGAEVIVPDFEVMPATAENFAWALKVMQQVQPDLLHLNGTGPLSFLSAAMATGTPIVQHLRNAEMAGMQDGVVLAKRCIAITNYLRREAMRFPVDPGRIRVVHDEVDSEWLNPAQFDRATCRSEFGLQDEERVALMVARVVPNKRYDLMLDAAVRIRQRVPNFRLVLKGDVYGGSLYAQGIQKRVRDLGLEDLVLWRDFVPDLRRLMAAADLLVLCSDREGLGSCVVEAMAMALPVVVTNTGGTHEVVDNGRVGGFVVPGSNPDVLAARVSELLSSPGLRRQLGQAGREFIRKKLDARISAQAVMEVYDEAIAEGSCENSF